MRIGELEKWRSGEVEKWRKKQRLDDWMERRNKKKGVVISIPILLERNLSTLIGSIALKISHSDNSEFDMTDLLIPFYEDK